MASRYVDCQRHVAELRIDQFDDSRRLCRSREVAEVLRVKGAAAVDVRFLSSGQEFDEVRCEREFRAFTKASEQDGVDQCPVAASQMSIVLAGHQKRRSG